MSFHTFQSLLLNISTVFLADDNEYEIFYIFTNTQRCCFFYVLELYRLCFCGKLLHGASNDVPSLSTNNSGVETSTRPHSSLPWYYTCVDLTKIPACT